MERLGRASFAIDSEPRWLEIISAILAQTALEIQEGLSKTQVNNSFFRICAGSVSCAGRSSGKALEAGMGIPGKTRFLFSPARDEYAPFYSMNKSAQGQKRQSHF